MNKIFKRMLIPNLMVASLMGVSLVPAQPASADEYILQDTAIGAGAGIISGAIRGRGNVVRNAAKGAAAGAAVNAVHGTRRQPQNRRNRNLGQDLATGAAAGAASGAILNGGKDVFGSAVDGAAAAGAIHVLTNRKRQ